MKHRRIFHKAVVILSAMALTILLTDKGTQARQDTIVRFAYQPGQAQIIIARDNGLLDEEFKKDGVSFELSKFAAGPPIIEAFAAKRVDIGQLFRPGPTTSTSRPSVFTVAPLPATDCWRPRGLASRQ
jgi:sulfonate transport system substrate-binding protein